MPDQVLTGECFYCGTIAKKKKGRAAVCVPCRQGIDAMKDHTTDGLPCEHEYINTHGNGCEDCGMEFIVCGPCTEVAGSERDVLHTAPACDERDI